MERAEVGSRGTAVKIPIALVRYFNLITNTTVTNLG
jgi:hypothetical protein